MHEIARWHHSSTPPRRLALSITSALGAAPAFAEEVPEEASQPPQPSAAVLTRTCEDNGALVVLNNFGGGTVSFTVLVDNEAFGTFDLRPGSQQSHLMPIMEDQTRTVQVTADGMSPVAATRTRDCEAAAPSLPAPRPPWRCSRPRSRVRRQRLTPSGTLPFTGTPNVAWIALAGFGSIVAGSLAWRRPRRVRAHD